MRPSKHSKWLTTAGRVSRNMLLLGLLGTLAGRRYCDLALLCPLSRCFFIRSANQRIEDVHTHSHNQLSARHSAKWKCTVFALMDEIICCLGKPGSGFIERSNWKAFWKVHGGCRCTKKLDYVFIKLMYFVSAQARDDLFVACPRCPSVNKGYW